MNSKERIAATFEGRPVDRIPLTTWCFGVQPLQKLQWSLNGQIRRFWYSMRMEHLHTLEQSWTVEDDFQRILAWRELGIDDMLDVSVAWSVSAEVIWKDSRLSPKGEDRYPILQREYETPAGTMRHAVRYTDPHAGPGWVIQPDHVPLIEDYNIPRAVEHIVSSPADVPAIRYLYAPPDQQTCDSFSRRMEAVGAFAQGHGVWVQAWTAFGMDAVVWFTGAEGAVMMALDAPEAFEELVNIIAETDRARTELAAKHPCVDMVVQRGWYSSTDFWSPQLFDRYVFGHLAELVSLVHRKGKKFGYVMTTGVETLGPRLVEAGVDLLYFIDPVQDTITLERARDLFGGKITLVGGTNTLSLSSGDPQRIRNEVTRALNILGPTGRFILHPVDALFPDTPWQGIEQMIDAWKDYYR